MYSLVVFNCTLFKSSSVEILSSPLALPNLLTILASFLSGQITSPLKPVMAHTKATCNHRFAPNSKLLSVNKVQNLELHPFLMLSKTRLTALMSQRQENLSSTSRDWPPIFLPGPSSAVAFLTCTSLAF